MKSLGLSAFKVYIRLYGVGLRGDLGLKESYN